MRLFLIMLILSCLSLPAFAQLESNFRNGGGIIIGESADECNAAAKGALRYNDTDKRFEGCNGTDGWNPLAQSSPQLGTPLYAISYTANSVATYNNDLEQGLLTQYNNDTGNGAYIYWRGQCRLDESGSTIPSSSLQDNCGRFICLNKTGRWAYMVQVGGRCTAGNANCNNGNFIFTWNCLATQ